MVYYGVDDWRVYYMYVYPVHSTSDVLEYGVKRH